MDSKDLSTNQAKALYRGLYPGLHYLGRLRMRMEKTGFRHDDPLYLLVCKAFDAVHHLSVQVHYLSCESGVGREPKRGL